MNAIEAYCLKAHKSINNNVAQKFTKNRGLSYKDLKKYIIGYSPEDNIIDYLYKQGFSKQELIDYGILIKTKYGYWHPFKNRIIFPIVNQSQKIVGITGRSVKHSDNVKYIHTTNTKYFSKGQVLYLEHLINDKDKRVFISEGPMDAIAINKKGYNSIATFGTGFSKTQLKKIKEYSKDYEINILFDNDEAGKQASLRLLKEMAKIACKINYVYLPNNIKDIDEYLEKYDMEDLQSTNGRTFFIDHYFQSLFDQETYHDAYMEFIKQYKFLETIEDGRIQRGFYIKLSQLNNLNVDSFKSLITLRRDEFDKRSNVSL